MILVPNSSVKTGVVLLLRFLNQNLKPNNNGKTGIREIKEGLSTGLACG